jgi:hypothetical protein
VTATISSRVRSFVGREAELQVLTEAAQGGDIRVVCLHGIAGMGKSALLRSFLESARAGGASVIELDCRTVEPTERGFLHAAGGFREIGDLVRRLAELPPPVLVTLDHYEVFRLMDTWLRQVLVPALPPAVTLVVAGRERPVAGWLALDGFRNLPLGPLGDDEAQLMLERRGVHASEAVPLNRIARGHPLALTLASAGVAEHPQLALEDAAMARVVEELSRLYLEAVDDRLARAALEAACVVRRATEPLLAATLEEPDGAEAVQRLLDLPFVDAGAHGLVVHEAVREAVAGFLGGANPVRCSGSTTSRSWTTRRGSWPCGASASRSPRSSSRCCGTSASARARPSRGPSSCARSGGRSSRAAATSSTPSCGRSGTSSARRRRPSRPFAEAATGCAPIGARTSARTCSCRGPARRSAAPRPRARRDT